MKLKELLWLAGVARPKPRRYGHEVRSFVLPRDGAVEYARWLHPLEEPKEVRQSVVDSYREFLRPGDVALDIGAHSGDTTVPMALAVGPTGAVLAFEPNGYVFPVLERNAALNAGKTRILPYPYAVAPRDGRMTFEYSDAGFCNGGFHEGMSRWRHAHAFRLEVECVALEPFLAGRHPDLVDRIRYVKVDAEGFDRSVLESMRGLLSRLRPYVECEFFKRLDAEQRLAQLRTLTSLGYRVRRIVAEDDRHGEEVHEGNLMAWRHFNVFCTPA
ncbi:MAG TPA: FkbM family methyltransferase [Anaeromyxobacter sp.]|nr:FkbM family methyltransferase [Anaeromyxobacter sp.]